MTSTSLPRLLGRYILVSRLHEGGMTEVYIARLAHQEGPVRPLVIKLLPKDSLNNPEAEVRFLEEARIVLSLTHGNIATAFEFGRFEGRPFLVMEYIPGPSLKALFAAYKESDERLAVEDTLFVSRELCRALGYAHGLTLTGSSSYGIIHRDLSPDNILISGSGQVKLTDFGIAEFISHVRRGPVYGKPAYVAPEVLQGESVGQASDFYSLGTVMYEALTGTAPFVGPNDPDVIEQALHSLPQTPSKLRPELSDEIDQLVMRLLEKDPSKRPSEAAKIEIEIHNALSRLAPSYTQNNLAQTLGQHMDLTAYDSPASKHNVKSALLAMGASLRSSDNTDQILTSGTVKLDAPTIEPGPPAKTKRLGAFVAVFLIAVVAVVVGLFVWPGLEDKDTKAKKTVASAPPKQAPEKTKPPKEQIEPDIPKKVLEKPQPTKRAAPGKTRKAPVKETTEPTNGLSHGFVNINSYPWSYVSVNGKRIKGHTPFKRLKLKPGKHQLLFENPELKLTAKRTVEVKAFEETSIGVRLAP